VCGQVAGGRQEEEAGGGGRRRRRREDGRRRREWTTKNKNPTQRCGEKYRDTMGVCLPYQLVKGVSENDEYVYIMKKWQRQDKMKC